MKSLNYLTEQNIKLPYEVDDEVGYGVHGQVFGIASDPSKVIKFSTLYETSTAIESEFKKINDAQNFLINQNHPNLAKVFETGLLMKGVRIFAGLKQQYYIYYLVMERLQKLTQDEAKVIKTVCDFYNKDQLFTKPLPLLIEELTGWFSFNKHNVLEFHRFLTSGPIKHNDVHRRNIMKDAAGNFKLIDFDRIELT